MTAALQIAPATAVQKLLAKAARRAHVEIGEVVYAGGAEYGNDGELYYRVLSGGQWGYVRAEFLRVMNAQELAAYFATARPTVAPTAAPTYSSNGFSGYGWIVKNRVNFRRTPSAGGTSITQLAQGTLVQVRNQVNAEGYEWYECDRAR